MVAHGKGRQEDFMDLSSLKYREKDEIENVFKSYARTFPFDIDTLWDQRLRAYYAERYDSRKALVDWDWQYSVRGTASIVHNKLFKDWRLRGIAFEFGDQTYSEPNRSLISYAPGVMKAGKDRGVKKDVKGYWSDVVVSPYFTFGYDSETPNAFAEGLYEIMNKGTGTEQHRHHVVEVAVYNLLSLLWEVETGSVYCMSKEHDIFSGLGKEQGKLRPPAAPAAADSAKPAAAAGGAGDCEKCPSSSHGDCEHGGGDGGGADSVNGGTGSSTSAAAAATTETVRPVETISEEVEIEELAKELRRAECIGESFDNLKASLIEDTCNSYSAVTRRQSTTNQIFPMIGDAASLLGKKTKYVRHFDAMFLSLRSAQFMQNEVADEILKPGMYILYVCLVNICVPHTILHGNNGRPLTLTTVGCRPLGALIAVETGKFLVSYTKTEKAELLKKEAELAASRNWRLMEGENCFYMLLKCFSSCS